MRLRVSGVCAARTTDLAGWLKNGLDGGVCVCGWVGWGATGATVGGARKMLVHTLRECAAHGGGAAIEQDPMLMAHVRRALGAGGSPGVAALVAGESEDGMVQQARAVDERAPPQGGAGVEQVEHTEEPLDRLTEKQLRTLTVRELRELAKARHLDFTKANKAELVAQLAAADRSLVAIDEVVPSEQEGRLRAMPEKQLRQMALDLRGFNDTHYWQGECLARSDKDHLVRMLLTEEEEEEEEAVSADEVRRLLRAHKLRKLPKQELKRRVKELKHSKGFASNVAVANKAQLVALLLSYHRGTDEEAEERLLAKTPNTELREMARARLSASSLNYTNTDALVGMLLTEEEQEGEGVSAEEVELLTKPTRELREMAKARNLKGYFFANKAALVLMLLDRGADVGGEEIVAI